MDIRISTPRLALAELLKVTIESGKLREVHHSNNYMTEDMNQIYSRTIFKFENEDIFVYDAFTNGYKGSGPNCLFEAMVYFDVEEKEANQLVYESSAAFSLRV